MISYFIVLIYRHVKVKELIDFKYDSFKFYLTCGLLMGSGILVSFNVPYYYVYSAGFFLIVLIIFRKDYTEMYKSFIRVMKNRKKKKNGNMSPQGEK